MKSIGFLVSVLTVFALAALAMVWWSQADPRALNGIAAIVAIVSLPLTGLLALFVHLRSVERERRGADHAIRLGPVVIAGNGHSDVRVEAGAWGVSISVGGIDERPTQQGAAGPIRLR